jgi:hypothetical protein
MLRLRFLGFFKGALLPNFNKMVKHALLIMGVQQLERHLWHCKYEFVCLAFNIVGLEENYYTVIS